MAVAAGTLRVRSKSATRQQQNGFEYELSSPQQAALVIGPFTKHATRAGEGGVPSVTVHGAADAAEADLERTAGFLSLVFKLFATRVAAPLPCSAYTQVGWYCRWYEPIRSA